MAQGSYQTIMNLLIVDSVNLIKYVREFVSGLTTADGLLSAAFELVMTEASKYASDSLIFAKDEEVSDTDRKLADELLKGAEEAGFVVISDKSIIRSLADQADSVTVLTSDNRMLSIIDDHVSVDLLTSDQADGTEAVLVTKENTDEICGFPPEKIPLFNALKPFTGENTAKALLRDYSTLDEITQDADSFAVPRTAEIIRKRHDEIESRLYSFTQAFKASSEDSDGVLTDEETEALLKKAENNDEKVRILRSAISSGSQDDSRNYKFISTLQELNAAAESLTAEGYAGFELFSDEGDICAASFSDGSSSYCLDLRKNVSSDDADQIDHTDMILKISEMIKGLHAGHVILSFSDIKNTLHLLGQAAALPSEIPEAESENSFKNDTTDKEITSRQQAFNWLIDTILSLSEDKPEDTFFDCSLAAYIIDPLNGAKGYPLEQISADYLDEKMPDYKALYGKRSLAEVMEADKKSFLSYACRCAETLCRLVSPLTDHLKQIDGFKLYSSLELPLVFCLYSMEREGIAIDAGALKQYGTDITAGIGDIENRIYEAAGEKFNINSPKQLGIILFEKLGLPGAKKTKSGYSTDAKVLDKLAEDYPFVRDILEYRQLTKLKSTYADGLFTCIASDHRIHTTFQQTVTATGRLSSTDPNLQNIPVRMELGRQIRRVFYPREGCVFLDADYSQIELRVLAHMSGDESLIEAYRENKDIHRSTASKVFHVPFDEVTPQQRRNAKAVNFGIVYGISSFGLGNNLDISRKEAQQYIDEYFKAYPKLHEYLDGLVASGREGYAETLFHRRRPLPELSSGNYMTRQFGERVAMNAPIQGTAADIIKIAMLNVYRRLDRENLRSRLLLQVHDELLVETYKDEIEQVKTILSEEMHHAADLSVPLEIEMEQGSTWYEAK